MSSKVRTTTGRGRLFDSVLDTIGDTPCIRVNNLGAVLRAQGELAGARAHYQRALRIDEAAYGPDHPEVATDVNNLVS